MNVKQIIIVFIYVTLIFTSLNLLHTAQCELPKVMVYIEVYSDGSSKVVYEVQVENPPKDIILPLLASPFYIEAHVEEAPINVETNDTHLFLTALGRDVVIVYYTSGLTEKVGEEWTFKTITPWPITISLPDDALIYDIEPEDFELVLVNDKPSFHFSKGTITIKYIITPEITSVEPSITTPAYSSILAPLIIAFMIVGVIAFFFVYMRKGRTKELHGIELDERDSKIVEVLSKYGEVTAQELMEKSRIPKTPLYRRLRKLEQLGYIEAVTRAGRTIYRLKVKRKQ